MERNKILNFFTLLALTLYLIYNSSNNKTIRLGLVKRTSYPLG